MKLTKNQKMLLGVGAVALVGYWLWKKSTTTTNWSGGVQSPRMKNATGGTVVGIKKFKTSQDAQNWLRSMRNVDPCKNTMMPVMCENGAYSGGCDARWGGVCNSCCCPGPMERNPDYLHGGDPYDTIIRFYACQKGI